VLSPEIQVVLLVGLALGPYVFGGLRTEQIAVYGFLAVSMVRVLWTRLRFLRPSGETPASPIPVILALSSILVVGLVGMIQPPIGTPYSPDSFLASLDNALLPIAAFTLGSLWLLTCDRRVVIRNLSFTLIILLSVNVVLAFVQATVPGYLDEFLSNFWTQDRSPESWSVAMNSYGNSRYSGVFNQPAEAGIAYSLGLICCVYLLRVTTRHVLQFAVRAATLGILLGGFLTQSKVFLLVGITIAAVSLFVGNTHKIRALLSVVALGVCATAAMFALGIPWSAARSVSFVSDGSLLDIGTATAGRYAQGNTVMVDAAYILGDSPIHGYGLPYFGTHSDSEWVHQLGNAGILGVLLLLLSFGILGYRLLRNSTSLPGPMRGLAGGVLLLVFGASFGLPALSANHVGAVGCILLALTLGGAPAPFDGRPRSIPARFRLTSERVRART